MRKGLLNVFDFLFCDVLFWLFLLLLVVCVVEDEDDQNMSIENKVMVFVVFSV